MQYPLSDHKPLCFQVFAQRPKGKKALPLWVWQHPWFEKAFKTAQYYDGLGDDSLTPYTRLQRLGRALKAAGEALSGCGEDAPPTTARDILKVTLEYFRALMQGRTDKCERLAALIPELGSLDKHNNSAQQERGLVNMIRRLHVHAMEQDSHAFARAVAGDFQPSNQQKRRQTLNRLPQTSRVKAPAYTLSLT